MRTILLGFSLALLCLHPSYGIHSNCFKQSPGKESSLVQRQLFIGGKPVPISIAVSKRFTHQLAAHIFAILLREMLGFQEIVFVEKDIFAQCASAENACRKADSVPEVMIDLEVWQDPERVANPVLLSQVIESAGLLGPNVSYGWFVPSRVVQSELKEHNISVNEWRAFRRQDIASKFDPTKKGFTSKVLFTDDGEYYCTESKCQSSMFKPEACNKQESLCASLLADYPEYNYHLLKDVIEELDLLVKVVWVGDTDLKKLVNYMKNQHIVFFNWTFKALLNQKEFTQVSFPYCKRTSGDGLKTCQHEVRRARKFIWSNLKLKAPEVYQVVKMVNFSKEEYSEMLGVYQKEFKNSSDMERVACMYIRQHHQRIAQWLPQNLSTLYIGGIFSLSRVPHPQRSVALAAQLAVDDINRNGLLEDYKLELLEADGQCQTDVTLMEYLGYVKNATFSRMIGILGPGCSSGLEPVLNLAKHYGTIVVSHSADGPLISSPDNYPHFFRTIPSITIYGLAYRKLFEEFGWKRTAVITEGLPFQSNFLWYLEDDLKRIGVDVVSSRRFQPGASNVTEYLRDLKRKNARIIIVHVSENAAKTIMCDAYHQEMTASQGYQWFLPGKLASTWLPTDQQYFHFPKSQEASFRQKLLCSSDRLQAAIDGHFSLTHDYFAQDEMLMQTKYTVKAWRRLYREFAMQEGMDMSDFAGFAYDAVWLLALALVALLKENKTHIATLHSEETFRQYAKHIHDTHFDGVSGKVTHLDSNRLSNVLIWQWQKNRSVNVGVCTPDGDLHLLDEKLLWLTAHKGIPDDGSPVPEQCSLEGLRTFFNTSCETAIVIANIIGFLVFAVLISAGFVLFRKKYEEKVKKTEARMRQLGLLTSTNLFSLDGWEMSREHIVINRKLGEGAFGTVYGGEAFIMDKGWLGVAVKTLKVGATIEEKLDFLSEAEMMKRFDHKNIVRLLGVCTVGEPVYTVMEFMLYGDLKTYLLARRHLAKEPDHQQSEEVSDKCLTNMALDIARGLSYLAASNYVHRDLACRNCLVNSGRTVKIGDFGMCRPMYDNDYYRFTKRGMLPVRWMAPESLNDGIFTTMSDVWSYGVLLYEIITFASLPYQGLTNCQVLDYVKGFNTLPVPRGCKRELDALLLRCWTRSPQQRPSASEIVEILATHNQLITPCLDFPLASYEEPEDPIEFTVGERGRLQSISSTLGWRNDALLNENKVPLVASASPKSPSRDKQHGTLKHKRTRSNRSLLLNLSQNATSL